MGSQQSYFSEICSTITNKIVNNFVFQPPERSSKKIRKLIRKQEHNFVSNNEYKISYWTSKPIVYDSSLRKCILFSHGNSSDIITMRSFCRYLANIFNMDCVIYDYLGYGASRDLNQRNKKTHPTESGSYISIKMIMSHLKEKYDIVYIVGQSLGTGVCVDYCATNDWTTPIILISPYKSIATIISNSLMTSSFDCCFNTFEKINKLKCPVKIIHGDSDLLIDISHGKDIYQALPDKSLNPVWLKGVGHTDILNNLTIDHLLEVFESE